MRRAGTVCVITGSQYTGHFHPTTIMSTQIKTRRGSSFFTKAVIFLTVCSFVTLAVNFFHGSVVHNLSGQSLNEDFYNKHLAGHLPSFPSDAIITTTTAPKIKIKKNDVRKVTEKLSGLNCDAFGGPSQEIAEEMVYWKDIPSDNAYQSPFYDPANIRYLTFEPDAGGWNNIRMSMETVLGMAVSSGRTLVLPPEQKMYLLGDAKAGQQRREFSFNDFFPMKEIAAEQKGLDIITMEEFLRREGVTGRLKDRKTGQSSFPPFNRTQWDGLTTEIKFDLGPWIQSVSYMPNWNPNLCLAAFPATKDPANVKSLRDLWDSLYKAGWPPLEQYIGNPTPVDASAADRLKENVAGRDQLCIYDTEMQQEPLIHFHGKAKLGGRLLVHFYAFLWFEDWKADLWMKRFIRDHVRYIDELQCGAARIIDAIRQRAKERTGVAVFDSFHIRRGDFQYKKTRVEANDIFNISKDEIADGTTVYLATDERNKTFFKPLADHWDVVYLDDYLHLVEGCNTNFYGILDQMIASHGRVFFGCWFSTFTGYMNRIRGYLANKHKLPGYEHGIVNSYYYALAENKFKMRQYYPLKQTYHAREYPVGWRDIDRGIEELASTIRLRE